MRVTVIPSDQVIIVDGVALRCAFPADDEVRAIQWDGAAGEIERRGGSEYFGAAAFIQPYVDLHAAERARIEAEVLPAVSAVPQGVSRFQARAALHLAGLLEQVEALMADPATPMLSRLAWQDATEFRRNSPTVLSMSDALGLTSDQIDQLFATAAGIQA